MLLLGFPGHLGADHFQGSTSVSQSQEQLAAALPALNLAGRHSPQVPLRVPPSLLPLYSPLAAVPKSFFLLTLDVLGMLSS